MKQAYTPNYLLPDFAQRPEIDCDLLEVIPAEGGIGLIRYRHPETGKTWSVPNIPCNQQRQVRARTLDYYAGEQEGRVRRFMQQGFNISADQANRLAVSMRQSAEKLRSEAAAIRNANQVRLRAVQHEGEEKNA